MNKLILITPYLLLKILQSKTLTKVYKECMLNTIFGTTKLNTVTSLTKECKYKNKSTVSRALKVLASLELIDKKDSIYFVDYIKPVM